MTSHTTIGVVAFVGVCAPRRLSHCALLRRGRLWAALQQCGRGSGLRFSLQAHHNSSSSTVESCNAPRKLALSAVWCLSRDEESHVDAILDTPVVDFYNEIMLTYPNAKVILTGVALFSHQEGRMQPLTSRRPAQFAISRAGCGADTSSTRTTLMAAITGSRRGVEGATLSTGRSVPLRSRRACHPENAAPPSVCVSSGSEPRLSGAKRNVPCGRRSSGTCSTTATCTTRCRRTGCW